MIFSDKSIRYSDQKYKVSLERMNNFYALSVNYNQAFATEAQIDMQFLSGSQEFYNTMYGPPYVGRRKNFFFNHIKPIINQVSGRQRQQRKTTVVTPRENADNETADQLTKVMMWAHEQDMVYETISNAFESALSTGMSLLQVWIDYRTDVISGDIKVDWLPYNTFMIDPFFTKMDLSDCNGIWRRSYLTKREVMSLLPEYADEILDIPIDNYDGKFNFGNFSYNVMAKDRMTYDEFWYRDYRKQIVLIDTKTGESTEWKGTKDKLDEFMSFYPEIIVQDTEVPTTKTAIVVEGRVLCDDNISGIDRMMFVPVICEYRPEMPNFSDRIQGLVRGLRDAQYLYNRKLIIEADSLEAVRGPGWIYKEDALVNPDDIFDTGNGKGLAIKATHSIHDSVQQIQPPIIPPTTQELRKQFSEEMTRISGISEELLGAASDDIAGVLSMLRQGTGLVSLQGIFDRVDQSQKHLGRIILDIIQTNFMPGKIQNILGKEQQISESFNSRLFGRYDCVVEEGMLTSTQKQMQFTQLIELRKLGVAIPDDVLLESVTMQNKNKLIEAVKAQAEAQAESQKQVQEITNQQMAAQAMLAEAQAKAATGQAIERVSRVEENKSLAIERKAEAKKDEEQALLNMVRALKELENIDLAQLEKLMFLSRTLRPQATAGQEEEQPDKTANIISSLEQTQEMPMNIEQSPQDRGI